MIDVFGVYILYLICVGLMACEVGGVLSVSETIIQSSIVSSSRVDSIESMNKIGFLF